MYRKICLLFYFFVTLLLCGQESKYWTFDNVNLGTGASVISCFFQDRQGLIWAGSDKGLFSYDGYSVKSHFSVDTKNNTQIYCGVIIKSKWLYLGSDNGILIYNITTDKYVEPPVNFPTDVRTMSLQGSILWIGTLKGLYSYNLHSNELVYYDVSIYSQLPHKTIYAIITTHDNQVFVGTYDGFCRYLPSENAFEKIELPINSEKNNQFINTLLEDTLRQCIWIGMEGSLLKYDLQDGAISELKGFQDNSVKSLALDSYSHLLAATDNGLYVYSEQQVLHHVIHDSRNLNSLSNNIIWSVFTDQDQNIWLGTNSGISLSRYNKALQYVPISEISGTGDGNQFYSIFKDSRNNYWFGGTNGIIRVNKKNENWSNAIWYSPDNKKNPLPHGRIRHIYEDSDSQLWIASDGSVCCYDYIKQQFIPYNIVDSTGAYNTNWAYHVFEDNQKKLWIATCLGGVFVVDKAHLMEHKKGCYVADYNYTTQNGLSGMFINQIIPDQIGNVWVLLYNNGIDKIVTDSHKVNKFPLNHLIGNTKPSFIVCDHAGYIWVGFKGGVLRINPSDDHTDIITFDTTLGINEVLSINEIDGNIWVSTTDGFWVVDSQTLEAKNLNLSDKRFLSIFYDSTEQRIYLGDVDGVATTSPEIINEVSIEHSIVVTALYVNNELFILDHKSIRYLDEIELNSDQNNIVLEFSNLPYSQEEKSRFVYRLKEVEKNWNILPYNINSIAYNNLRFGSYELVICRLKESDASREHQYVLKITIRPPWFYTLLAKSIYVLILITLIAWIINFFRVKSRLKFERLEKEKIMEQSHMKMDFLTNLSHELKTPLSMIIAPISRVLSTTESSFQKQQLKLVQHNAIKINSLIHRILDFNRIGSDTDSLLIVSRIELISFARKVFTIFEDAEDESALTFKFECNREDIYLDMDVVKWESILTNLLSNAVKYTDAGGIITLAITFDDKTGEIEISVSDTGIGIPLKDIPYVFQRFFQSSKTVNKKDGTGIGLYLVKTYTELHGGKISIASQENKGTTLTITLPRYDNIDPKLLISAKEKTMISDAISDDDKPLILIVDDSREMTTLISDILSQQYRCVTAASGHLGIDLCNKLLPDLIISDFMMPKMNGLEMCQQIKKHIPTSTIPIILLTGKDDKDTELESIQHNIDAFIPKPFEPDILLFRIEQLIRKKQRMEKKVRMEMITIPKVPEVVSANEKFLINITRIIEDHISDYELNVTALCEISGINNKQIYRKIKQLTNMSPVEYIKSVRMKKAAMLLRQKKFSVAEVMYMVGFSNHSYFSKCFKAEFDKTPWQYEKEE